MHLAVIIEERHLVQGLQVKLCNFIPNPLLQASNLLLLNRITTSETFKNQWSSVNSQNIYIDYCHFVFCCHLPDYPQTAFISGKIIKLQ